VLVYGRWVVGDELPGSGLDAPSSVDHGLAGRRAAMVEQMLCFARSLQAALAESASRTGLSQSDFQALVRLVVADGLSGAAVRRILGVTSSSISELADRLEQAGMIARTSAPSDRRVVVLKPTAEGRRVVGEALGPLLDAMAAVVSDLTDDELAVVSRFLDGVERGLSEVANRSLSRPGQQPG